MSEKRWKHFQAIAKEMKEKSPLR